MKTIILLTSLILSLSVSATILPKNDLHLQDNLFTEDANMTEADFNQIIDQVIGAYNETVVGHGATLTANKLWSNPTVNASAQQMGNRWVVNMYGGLARRVEVTPDGFALVVCHELGHHLAGYFFYGQGWASSEGQSDYFASQACARTIWKDQAAKNAAARETVHATAKAGCDSRMKTETEQNLCYRTAMAGQSLAKLLSALGGTEADFDTPDDSVISSTQTRHPAGQCRLDTYFSGALCGKAFDKTVIPGRNHPDGQNSLGAELESAEYSCTRANDEMIGSRPLCWFKPQIESETLTAL